MGNEIKTTRLKNGLSVYIAHDEDVWDTAEDILGGGGIEHYIYGGRNTIDVFTGDKSRSAPSWEDAYDLLEEVADQYGKNARGSDVASVMGLDWMAMYVLLFNDYPPFNKGHDAYDLALWQARLLDRAEKWFNANYEDHSALQLLNMSCRVSALAETCEDLGEHTVNIALNQLSMHRCLHMTNDGEQEDVLSDVDHQRLAYLFESTESDLQDEAAAFVSTYCRHYIKHRLEMM